MRGSVPRLTRQGPEPDPTPIRPVTLNAMSEAHRPAPKQFVGLRVGTAGLDAIDGIAADLGRTRSQVMRLLLALGHQQWQSMTPGQRESTLYLHKLSDRSPQ